MKNEVSLIRSMYPCQDIPAVIFDKRCPDPCLYCGLHKYEFPDEKILAVGFRKVIDEMSKYKGAYFSPVTDPFLIENADLTHDLLEKTWKLNPNWVPLINTKQIIPLRTLKLLVEHKDSLVLQISIPSLNQKLLSVLEPGSASVESRLMTFEILHKFSVKCIAVIMPWFDFPSVDKMKFAKQLQLVGIQMVIISTCVLSETQKQKIFRNSYNFEIQEIQDIVKDFDLEPGATKNGYVPLKLLRVKSLTKLTEAFNSLGIKVKICISDNHDLADTSLPLCGKFVHKNFNN